MKHIYTYALFLIPFMIHGQITLNIDDMPKAGDVISSANCEIPIDFNIGSAGANQTYDFSMLIPIDSFSTNFISPNGTAGASEFPTANLAAEFDGDFVYYEQTNSELLLLGSYIDTSENGMDQYFATHFNPSSKIFEIPSTYNSSFTDMTSWTNTFPDNSVGIDSFRTTSTTENNILFDGFGTVIIPTGSFEALRERRISINTTEFDTYSMGMWTNAFTSTFTDTSYNWYGKNNPNLASVNILDGEIVNISYSISGVQVLTPVADFTSNDIGNGSFEFMDNSTNIPTSWLWDFDDGNTSTQQDPQHTFVSSDTYNVCLTATNSAGSNTHCKLIDVIITSTNDLNSTVNINIFPNPVNQILHIYLESQNPEPFDFQLMNSACISVLELRLENNKLYDIDVNELAMGMYFYLLKDDSGKVRNRGKVMKY